MGVAANLVLPLGDVVTSVETFVDVFLTLYGIVLLAFLLLTWVRLPYSPTLDRIQRFLYDVSVPYLRLFRRVLPMTGSLDFSPILAFLSLSLIDLLVHWILNHFH